MLEECRMSKVMIELKNITKKYRDTVAVDQCNLVLEQGKIYGLVGKNGAGKTTMMRMIAGLSIPTRGIMEINTKNMGTLIETPSLNGSMTAKENLKFYRMLNGSNEGKQQLGIKEAADSSKVSLSTDELLHLVGLDQVGNKKVRNFSLGMRQRLGIAVALLGNPEFLMLDEPVNGLDPIGVMDIRNLIKRLNQEYGMTVLISSHNLPELYQTATDFIIIDQGKVRKEITQEKLDSVNNKSLEEYFYETINESHNL